MNKSVYKIFVLTGLILLVFLISVLNASRIKNTNDIACVPNSGEIFKPHIKLIDNMTYEAFIVARNWSFEPRELYIPLGCDLDIFVTSSDHDYELVIDNKAVNIAVMMGTVMKQTVHFDKSGIYKMKCRDADGTINQNLQSEIIVSEKVKL